MYVLKFTGWVFWITTRFSLMVLQRRFEGSYVLRTTQFGSQFEKGDWIMAERGTPFAPTCGSQQHISVCITWTYGDRAVDMHLPNYTCWLESAAGLDCDWRCAKPTIYLWFIAPIFIQYMWGNKLFQQPIYNSITLVISVCACETCKGISSEK